MRQRIRLTESDLHRIIRNSVERVLNESSRGVSRACEYSKGKVSHNRCKYGENSPQYARALEQQKNFEDEYDRLYKGGNTAKKARLATYRQEASDERRKAFLDKENKRKAEEEEEEENEKNNKSKKGFFGRMLGK